MSSYFLCGFEYEWDLVRETSSSQNFIVDVGDLQGLKATFDIHYTKPEIAHVTVCLIGPKENFTDGLSHGLFSDLGIIIKRHGDYHVIDYSLIYSDDVFHGNFAMSKNILTENGEQNDNT